jgi:hypothetical protein
MPTVRQRWHGADLTRVWMDVEASSSPLPSSNTCARWKISTGGRENISPPPPTLPAYKRAWWVSPHLDNHCYKLCHELEHTISPSISSSSLSVKR